MGIKYIHIVLIVASIILCVFFGSWTINRHYTVAGYASFAVAAALVIYCIQFIKKTKAM